MGYTHYWQKTDVAPPPEAFGRTALDAKKIIAAAKKQGIAIVDLQGTPKSKPEFTEAHFSFNGPRPDDDYESFWFDAVSDGFAFCKTAYRPYDAVVCAVLISAAAHYGPALDVSSDGSWDVEDEWALGQALFTEVFGVEPVKPSGVKTGAQREAEYAAWRAEREAVSR